MTALLLVLAVPASASAACPNEAFRAGSSSALPDCRAYELVTPPETNGRILAVITNFGFGSQPQNVHTELSSLFGDGFVYEVYASTLDQPAGGNGFMDVYEAQRGASGWQTQKRISRSSASLSLPIVGESSPDHSYLFTNDADVEYLREPDGANEVVGVGSLGEEPHAQGRLISDSGTHVIFSTGTNQITQSAWCTSCQALKLEPNAPPTGTGAVYDRSANGPTRVVSLLPGNVTPNAGEQAFYKGASKDGAVVAFTIGESLYLRVNNSKTEEIPSPGATFAGLSRDGTYLFYLASGTIHRFTTATEEDSVVNPAGEAEIVNISADGSHIYFISEQQLDGLKGTAGQPNLYVWSGDTPSYIATVEPSDLVRTNRYGTRAGEPTLTNWTGWVTNRPKNGARQGPGADSSRVTPDGTVLVFESKAQLTSYDNADPSTCPSWTAAGPDGELGTPDDEVLNPKGRCTEIYRFDAENGEIECTSCNPTGSPPVADARLQELDLVDAPFVINNVSSDGTKVFFETPEALVAADTDGITDIYEWQEGSTAEPVHLISSGKSSAFPPPGPGIETNFPPRPNLLLSITPDGSNVFFIAQEALVPGAGEGGAQAIYDARIGGGFPAPSIPERCLEEQCRGNSAATYLPASRPSSETLSGAGNAKAGRHHCRRRKGAKKHRGCKHHHRVRARSSAVTAGEAPPGAPASESSVVPPDDEPGDQSLSDSSDASVVAAAGAGETFGIEKLEASLSSAEAGAHPDLITSFEIAHRKELGGQESATAAMKTLSFSLSSGFVGFPTSVPTCSTGDFFAFGNCPADTQVGITKVRVGDPLYTTAFEPIFNLAPPHPDREVARLGFIADIFPIYLDVKVRTASDYGVTATVHGAPGLGVIVRAKTTLWGSPSSPVHDAQRLTPFEAIGCPAGIPCKAPGEIRPSTIPPPERRTFFTNPSACEEGQFEMEATTYQLPEQLFTVPPAPLGPVTGCTGLPFAPTFEAEPTSHVAGGPTGLHTKVLLPQHLGEGERATATMREARVTLPEGMQVAAGTANWIGTCSDQQVGYHEEVEAACPDSSKLGTATIVSPALPAPIEGTIYQRSPQPGHQLGLWLTSDALGMHIKLPGELEPDKNTGRLTAVFRDLPQVPVEEIDLDVWGGPRAPLQNPDHCGTFTTDFSFSPHSDDPAATGQSRMQITEGCSQGFSPTLYAGVTEPTAGKFSPFVFDLNRGDGQQALRGFKLHLPDGELAKLKGVPLCSDAEAAAGNCPESSRIGSLTATAGPGPEPLSVPQPGKPQPQIYLAGPYQGSPFSILSEVPAQAGPFDLGVLTVRSGLDVEPETGRAVVKADPLPQFFEGIGIAYRHLHAVIDRPDFSLNPTDCREMAVGSDVASTQGTIVHPQARFQVDGCKALKFKPKLSLKLKGGTRRAQYPALTAVLKARGGDANIASASVALPHSEFLAQEHIGTICTRKQFAADKCPKGSVYGKAKAWTPLLDKPLSGPVYLRSSNHPLPDLVAKLGGQLEIDLVGRIDSVHGGIRTTFESVPDAPVGKFVLRMKGGAKGLLTNSTDICRGKHRAAVRLKAQNGRAVDLRPVLTAGRCGRKQ